MSTWAGAIIDAPTGELRTVAAQHRIVVQAGNAKTVLVHAEVGWGSLVPPPFAQAVSTELDCSVVAFFVQTNASVAQLEHWRSGQLVRKLEYVGDRGGWVTDEGEPQAWESVFFFDEEEGTAEDRPWPHNLLDEITDEDIARYERARAVKDASSVMDLLGESSASSFDRVCAHFGLDAARPGAIYRPPRNHKPRIVLAAIVLFLIAAFLLGVLTKH